MPNIDLQRSKKVRRYGFWTRLGSGLAMRSSNVQAWTTALIYFFTFMSMPMNELPFVLTDADSEFILSVMLYVWAFGSIAVSALHVIGAASLLRQRYDLERALEDGFIGGSGRDKKDCARRRPRASIVVQELVNPLTFCGFLMIPKGKHVVDVVFATGTLLFLAGISWPPFVFAHARCQADD